VATSFALPTTPPEERPTPLSAPLRALGHRGLLMVAVTAMLYNFGFFTLLAFTPFPLDMNAHQVGLIFFGWGVLLAVTSVVVAPWVQRRAGTITGVVTALTGFGLVLVGMAVWTDVAAVLVVGVIVAGAFLGINNTLITETVMKAAPVERGVASSAYSFVRFTGGAVAPWLAGTLGENVGIHAPFWVGAVCVLGSAAVMLAARGLLRGIDGGGDEHGGPQVDSVEEAELLSVGDA
jgi:ACDE family multidrug resistance protein